jgi:hypothetical protein
MATVVGSQVGAATTFVGVAVAKNILPCYEKVKFFSAEIGFLNKNMGVSRFDIPMLYLCTWKHKEISSWKQQAKHKGKES